MNATAPSVSLPRAWMWVQLAIAWLPLWALFTAMIVIVHGNAVSEAAIGSGRMIAPGALLGIAVYRFASRLRWPHPFRSAFVVAHVLAALLFAATWYAIVSVIDSIVTGQPRFMIGPGPGPFLITGVWLYIVVASLAYANLAAQRAAQLEAQAARVQLEALRAQLHPHFLFNALHTIVQLIPGDPREAAHATEQLADTLRAVLEEQRDVITLGAEWSFVERYLALERLRFGERLRLRVEIEPGARDAQLPSFALQTLVENAIRHGAAPKLGTTEVVVHASTTPQTLSVVVSDDGVGADAVAIEAAHGTGLRRLRDRLRWLYGDSATLRLSSSPGAGFRATLDVPRDARE